MNISAFENSPVGNLEPISGEHRGRPFSHFAFVPDPLPARVPLTEETNQSLMEAILALGRLDGAGRRLPRPELLARPVTRREAVSTSALEGTYATLPEVFQSELFEEEERSSRDVKEVLAYVRAAERGFSLIEQRPVSLNLIRELHGILMKPDSECPASEKGEFRNRQNFIGPREGRVEDAYFVPPPPHHLIPILHAWEEWIHSTKVPLLVRVALGHYQFETLHPFIDGNGRLGRLVAVLMIMDEGMLTVPLLNISPYLEQRRDRYQELLREVSATGRFDPWIKFFLDGITLQARDALQKTDNLVALKEEMVAELRTRKLRGLAIQVAEDLIGQPVISAKSLRERYGVTYQAGVYAIDRLLEAGLIQEWTTGRGRKGFIAPQVLELING